MHVFFFSLALDESADICDVAQLFVWKIDNFNSSRNLLALSYSNEKQEYQTFWKIKSCLENQQLDTSKLFCVCTDESASKIGKVAGNVVVLERCLGSPILK